MVPGVDREGVAGPFFGGEREAKARPAYALDTDGREQALEVLAHTRRRPASAHAADGGALALDGGGAGTVMLIERAREPVEQVLEAAGDLIVVFGGEEPEAVRV